MTFGHVSFSYWQPGWASRGQAQGLERVAVSPVGPYRGGPRGLQGPLLTWILGPPLPPLISSVAPAESA